MYVRVRACVCVCVRVYVTTLQRCGEIRAVTPSTLGPFVYSLTTLGKLFIFLVPLIPSSIIWR